MLIYTCKFKKKANHSLCCAKLRRIRPIMSAEVGERMQGAVLCIPWCRSGPREPELRWGRACCCE